MSFSKWELYFQNLAFILHLGLATSLAGVLLACNNTPSFTNTGYTTERFSRLNSSACATENACYRNATPWADDRVFPMHRWNPFGLITMFEFFSAAFAFFYIRKKPLMPVGARLWVEAHAPIICSVLASLGVLVYTFWFVYWSQDNWCQLLLGYFCLGLSICIFWMFDAVSRQFKAQLDTTADMGYSIISMHGIPFKIPIGATGATNPDEEISLKMDTLLRYAEYTVTAPLLWMAVLSIMISGPPAWAFIGGYGCIVVCCVMGVPLHLMQMEKIALTHRGRMTLGVRSDFTTAVAKWVGIGSWHSHDVAKWEFLKNSWLGMVVALAVVYYFGRVLMFNEDVPMYVRFGLWNMLFLYSSFGIAGTVFYSFQRTWRYQQLVFDALSIMAKIPICVSICYGFLQMPGGGCMV